MPFCFCASCIATAERLSVWQSAPACDNWFVLPAVWQDACSCKLTADLELQEAQEHLLILTQDQQLLLCPLEKLQAMPKQNIVGMPYLLPQRDCSNCL
jgi:hypothetical protein